MYLEVESVVDTKLSEGNQGSQNEVDRQEGGRRQELKGKVVANEAGD